MLTRNQHPRMNYISRLLALPLLVIVYSAFTIKIAEKIDKGYASNKLSNKIIVVLDAGHGGQDKGAINKDGITEKNLTLQLVKKIKALNIDENIQIILSRDNDVYASPPEKADFAKTNNADLFISIHLDNTPKEKWNTVSGMNVFVAKDGISNVEKSKVLATSILNSFKINYGLAVPPTISQRQSIYVLQANSFPSVLIEAGYLTNDKDAAYLLSEKGQEAFAKNVLNAIKSYSNLNSLVQIPIVKEKIDSPPTTKAEMKHIQESEKGITLVDNVSLSFTTSGVDDLNNFQKDGGLIIINGIRYTVLDLQNKVIKGGKATIYQKGNADAIKKYGKEAVNGALIIENASIEIIPEGGKTGVGNNSLTISQAPDDDVKLFKKLGHVFIRVETNGELPYKGPNRLVFRDGKPQFSQHNKTYKGDIIIILSSKEAIEKYGASAFDGAVEITSKEQNEIVSVQKVNLNQTISDKVFTQVEVKPEFPGGKDAWRKFLQTNLKASIAVKEGLKAGNHTFITRFIVHEDGSLSDFTSEKNINDTIAKYCIDVIKKGPKWKPAIQNGNIVSAYRKQPITFSVAEE